MTVCTFTENQSTVRSIQAGHSFCSQASVLFFHQSYLSSSDSDHGGEQEEQRAWRSRQPRSWPKRKKRRRRVWTVRASEYHTIIFDSLHHVSYRHHQHTSESFRDCLHERNVTTRIGSTRNNNHLDQSTRVDDPSHQSIHIVDGLSTTSPCTKMTTTHLMPSKRR
jgi:hypothetical protein